MKNPTAETLALVAQMAGDGATIKAIIAETGLNYSQVKYELLYLEIPEVAADEKTPAKVEELRKSGESWGRIAAAFRMPESRVRKMWTESTDLKSQGLRVGKGGRFYYGPDRGQPLYADQLQKTGTEIPKGAKYQQAVVEASVQKLIHEPMETLKAKAEALGISVPKKPTKAQLVQKIRKAELAEFTGVDA